MKSVCETQQEQDEAMDATSNNTNTTVEEGEDAAVPTSNNSIEFVNHGTYF
jgi:hypothetical protein